MKMSIRILMTVVSPPQIRCTPRRIWASSPLNPPQIRRALRRIWGGQGGADAASA